MSRIKVEVLGEGQHPSERVVAVTTADGERETMFVDEQSVYESFIDIGHPVGTLPGRVLVELPRETTSGRWRVWIAKGDMSEAAGR